MTASGPAPFVGSKQFRKAAGAWARRHEAGARLLYRVMNKFFREQAEFAAAELIRHGAGATAAAILRPEWDQRLLDAAEGALGKLVADGAASELSRAKRFAGFTVKSQLPAPVASAIETFLRTVMGQGFWKDMATAVRNDLGKALGDAIENGDNLHQSAKRIRSVLTDAGRARAELIARTEATGALNAGHQAARDHLDELGFLKGKEWACIKDGDTRPEHLAANGQQVGPRDEFVIGGERAAYPGDMRLTPGQRCNCRCTVFSVLKEAEEL